MAICGHRHLTKKRVYWFCDRCGRRFVAIEEVRDAEYIQPDGGKRSGVA